MNKRRSLASLLALLAIGLAFSVWAADRPAASPGRTGWQHLAMEHASADAMTDRELAGKINQLGRDGWEMFAVTSQQEGGTTTKTVFYFKRPL